MMITPNPTPSAKWVTKNGEEILISMMSDSHLLNAYRLVLANYENNCCNALNRCHGFDDLSDAEELIQDFYEENVEPLGAEINARLLPLP